MKETRSIAAALGAIVAAAALLVASYYIMALVVYGFCWSFDLPWSWKISFGVWIAYVVAATMLYGLRPRGGK